MSVRPPDYCWEALVEETRAVPEIERGALNKALKAIRACALRDGIAPDFLPDEIRLRARAYRLHPSLGRCLLTPMALAKNWNRVVGNRPQSSEEAALNALRHPKHGNVSL